MVGADFVHNSAFFSFFFFSLKLPQRRVPIDFTSSEERSPCHTGFFFFVCKNAA